MKISVFVKTNSKKETVEKQSDDSYVVRVRVPPIEGKANERVQELLSEYLQIPKTSVEIVSGFKSKKKIFEVK